MKKLNKKEEELVALGAALGSNCIPCTVYHIGELRKNRVPDEQIKEAIKLAEKVRKVPSRHVLETAFSQLEDLPGVSASKSEKEESDCGC